MISKHRTARHTSELQQGYNNLKATWGKQKIVF